MTLDLPPSLTKISGADALAHCIEGYAANTYHPIADGIALEGIRLIRESLPKVVASPRDVGARGKMLLAASMGALAIQKGVGAAHALAHPLSDAVGMPHGLANAIVLPAVMEFNATAAPGRYAAIGRAMGVEGCSSDEEAAQAGVRAVKDFLGGLGIPLRLRDAEVGASMVPELASHAVEDESHVTNPRACTEEDLRGLYEAAY
jgi:alcohol dehydrogenase class IV